MSARRTKQQERAADFVPSWLQVPRYAVPLRVPRFYSRVRGRWMWRPRRLLWLQRMWSNFACYTSQPHQAECPDRGRFDQSRVRSSLVLLHLTYSADSTYNEMTCHCPKTTLFHGRYFPALVTKINGSEVVLQHAPSNTGALAAGINCWNITTLLGATGTLPQPWDLVVFNFGLHV